MTWSGQWKRDEASGLGVLEADDGRRYEGEAEPVADGAPVRCGGWLWTPDAPLRGQIKIEPRPALPAPAK